MSAVDPFVVHVVGADVSFGKAATLGALLEPSEESPARTVLYVGRGRWPAAGQRPMYVPTPLRTGWVASLAVSRLIADAAPPRTARTVVHLWSPTALSWCQGIEAPGRSFVLEAEAGQELAAVARGFFACAGAGRTAVACRSVWTRQRLVAMGVPPESCLVLPEVLAHDQPDPMAVAKLRARLDLAPGHTLAVALPPVSRSSGTFFAVWSTLLVEKIRPGIRILLPADGRELWRVLRLVRACRHEHVVRFAERTWTCDELATAADLAVFLPVGDAPLSGLVQAMALGRPTVATDVPSLREILVPRGVAWLCRPADPKDAAAVILRALEEPEESRHRAETARDQVLREFDRRRTLALYARLYANLAADREVRDGIVQVERDFVDPTSGSAECTAPVVCDRTPDRI
jgi:hypothetical protein